MDLGRPLRNSGLVRMALGAAVLLAVTSAVQADPADVAAQKLGRVLRDEEWPKVLVAVREDPRSRFSTDSATICESLCQQLLMTCQAADKEAATPADECIALDKLTVASAPHRPSCVIY